MVRSQEPNRFDPRSGNPEAVDEVLSGKRLVANAAWWGFDAEDSTDAIQSAIMSGAKRVVVPNMGRDWIVRPIEVRQSVELVFERGVQVAAKRGEFKGRGDCLLRARDVEDLVIRGYGASLRMQKEDYIVGKVLFDSGSDRWFGQYEKAEWRSVLSIEGCSNVRIYGLTLRDSGGDGIYVAGSQSHPYSKKVRIRDVVCDNNYRQGISVISVDGLLVENSVFRNTWGTPPSSGVDLEPNRETEKMRNVIFKNCRFEDNYGEGIELYLSNLSDSSDEVSIRFENCYITSKRGSGLRVSKIRRGVKGSIDFVDCVVEATEGYGLKVQDKSPDGSTLNFSGCIFRDVAKNPQLMGQPTPIWIQISNAELSPSIGDISFTDCIIEDEENRPPVLMEGPEETEMIDIRGEILVRNTCGPKIDVRGISGDIPLKLRPAEW